MSPYMWITNGPMSIVPVCGDGIEATTARDSAGPVKRLRY
jgi:hypothetical protein